MSQTTSLELPNKSFESLLTILNNINDNIAEIGTCLSDAFDTSRVKNFGESLNTVVGIFASIIGIIGTFYGNMQMLNEFGAAFSSINGAASGMGASIASACALSIPEIALVAAAIAAISGAALICQDEIKASCTQTLGWIDNDFLSPLAEGISEITGWLWEAHIKPLWDNMKSFTNSLREMANAIWNNFFGPIVHWLSDTFCPVFSIAIEIIVDVIGTIIGVIVDLFNGEVISFNLSRQPVFAQVVDMLEKAFSKIPDNTNLILHSDQGWQYQMKQYQWLLKDKGIRQSMSRKGNCLDNSLVENFFGLLKSELFYMKEYKTIEELEKDIIEYIDYYNNKRIKGKLKGMSPVQYRVHSQVA